MDLKSILESISDSTPRTLQVFARLFELVESVAPDGVRSSQQQRAIVADTIIFKLSGDGWAGRLPFSYGEAYLAVGIPKEFLA
jgi:hypothetical protein